MLISKGINKTGRVATDVVVGVLVTRGANLGLKGVTSSMPKAPKSTNNPNSWKPGTEVTEAHVREAMINAPLQTQQSAVSLPAINRYTQRLANGELPPPIKVDSGIIVDGNHRYISSRIVGIKIDEIPGSGGRIDRVVKWNDMFIDPFDWGNK